MITIYKEPIGVYPAYNDSYIQFESDLEDTIKAEITVYPTTIFTKKFKLYPDSDGMYIFNLKECVKYIFNTSKFEDKNVDENVYSKSIDGLYLNQTIDIEVFNDATSEDVTKVYQFYKASKQIGDNYNESIDKILMHSDDDVNYNLIYNEGFPLFIDILRVLENQEVVIKSLTTGVETEPFKSTSDDSFRINIDRGGGNNWTLDSVLPLIVGFNRLELRIDNVFKFNLNITKKKICNGVYLKYLNRSGSYSNILMEKYTILNVVSKINSEILTSQINNINELTGLTSVTGKEGSIKIVAKAKYKEIHVMDELLNSPFIQLYTSQNAYVKGKFINVKIQGGLSFSNKRNQNEMIVNIELPKLINLEL